MNVKAGQSVRFPNSVSVVSKRGGSIRKLYKFRAAIYNATGCLANFVFNLLIA